MFHGDRSRKQVLVDYGFRLPSALDNRPLTYDEFRDAPEPGHRGQRHARAPRSSSGRAARSSSRSSGRPGSSTPRSRCGRSRDRSTICSRSCARRRRPGERVLVTTLTKRMAEELTNYFTEVGVRCRYLHSDIEVMDRVSILSDFRRGVFDCLIGINLLREGLDLPEVAVVAILDADKEGFLRSETSLIQTAGRAARNLQGPGDLLRRRGDGLDAARDGGDVPPPRHPGGVQPRARDRPGVDRQAGQLAARAHGEPRLLRDAVGSPGPTCRTRTRCAGGSRTSRSR